MARLDGRIVGATNELREAGCRPTAIEKLRLAPAVLAVGPRALPRVGRWLADWERRDPDAPHSHYGPFGVEPALQGRGIGSLVLGEYTRRLDADGLDAYLETDKPENVALYSRFGFEVIDEGAILGDAELVHVAPGRRRRAGDPEALKLVVRELLDDLARDLGSTSVNLR